MHRLKLTNSNVPTISNTGSRISPFRSTGLYMELHKLDYKRRNLLERIEKLDREKKQIEEKLVNLDQDMIQIKASIENSESKHKGEESKVEAPSSPKLKY